MTNPGLWNRVGEQPCPSWYLDPLAAAQKRDAHLDLLRQWLGGATPQRLLKTDLFEEAFGDDQILAALAAEFPGACYGIDQAYSVVLSAARRHAALGRGIAVMDVRSLAFRDGAFDVIVSTSTLDHFETRGEFLTALAELVRVLAPGGRAVITLDNPWNPLFHPLRWVSRCRQAPFPLGYTTSRATLAADLQRLGLTVERQGWLLHNPRGLSTALFLLLRRLLGRRAGGLIRALLALFALLGRLPSRPLTACFHASLACKRPGQPPGNRSEE